MLNYYGDTGVREICHAVKTDKRKKAVHEIAKYLISLEIVDQKSILIPVPQHYGYADYTKEICNEISAVSGAKVCDILKCIPHESIFIQKKMGYKPSINYFIDGKIPDGKLYFVDNVIATGISYNEANKLFGYNLIPFVYAKDE